jgi:hypothetical protein
MKNVVSCLAYSSALKMVAMSFPKCRALSGLNDTATQKAVLFKCYYVNQIKEDKPSTLAQGIMHLASTWEIHRLS